jgi:hypothetical protein
MLGNASYIARALGDEPLDDAQLAIVVEPAFEGTVSLCRRSVTIPA